MRRAQKYPRVEARSGKDVGINREVKERGEREEGKGGTQIDQRDGRKGG
jgi:hypothetical protein